MSVENFENIEIIFIFSLLSNLKIFYFSKVEKEVDKDLFFHFLIF